MLAGNRGFEMKIGSVNTNSSPIQSGTRRGALHLVCTALASLFAAASTGKKSLASNRVAASSTTTKWPTPIYDGYVSMDAAKVSRLKSMTLFSGGTVTYRPK